MLDKAISRAVFERDGWMCRHCRERSGLHPHHLVYKSQRGPDEMWNLITLCSACHRAHHDGDLAIDFDATWESDFPNLPILLGVGPVRFRRLHGWKPQ